MPVILASFGPGGGRQTLVQHALPGVTYAAMSVAEDGWLGPL